MKKICYTIFLLAFGFVASLIIPAQTSKAQNDELKKPKVSLVYEDNEVTLGWNKVKGATKYNILKKNEEGKFVKIGSTSKLSYIDKDVKSNNRYQYKVRAIKKTNKIKKQSAAIVYSIYTAKIDPAKKMIALTFDDGPGLYTKEIVDCLNKHDARATFFVVGNRINHYPGLLTYSYERGNEIGNHSYDHGNFYNMTKKQLNAQISKTDKLIKNQTGEKPKLFRSPGGAYNNYLKKNVKKPFIQWNVDTLDWKYRNASHTVKHVMTHLSDGNIILMHDIHESTKDAVLKLIPKLKKAGYQIVTISELAKYRNIDLKNGVRYFSAN